MRVGLFAVIDHYPELGQTAAERFDELLRQMALADDLGFHSYWVAEHHFADYGLCPSPAVLLAAAAQRTGRIRLGVAVSVLPFHHPLRVAEDYALVDVLSGGRLNFGVGGGYLAHEFAGFGLDPADRHERQAEAFDVIRRAWLGESTALDGKHYRIADARPQVRPLQTPHPPVWWAMTRPEALPFVAAKGYPPMWIPYVTSRSIADVERTLAAIPQAYAAAGHADPSRDTVVAVHTVVAATDKAAEPLATEAIERYMGKQRRAAGSRATALPREVAIIGGPGVVRERAQRFAEAGAGELLCLMNFGGLADEPVREGMARVADALGVTKRPAAADAGGSRESDAR